MKIELREVYRAGDQYQVETTSELSGTLTASGQDGKAPAAKPLVKSGKSRSIYDERILSINADQAATRTLRRYQTLTTDQRLGEELISARLRGQIKQIVLFRDGQSDVTFSPDGPLLLGELEQVRTDIYLPRLVGLLPTRPVALDESWGAQTPAVQELTDLQQVQTGELQCTLSRIDELPGRREATVKFSGRVSGPGAYGTNQQTLVGNYRFDLEARRLVWLRFEVTSVHSDKNNSRVGDFTASFQLVRTLRPSRELELQGLALEPTEENTLLLVQEPRLGLELVHSRRWVPRPVNDRQWVIDGPAGSGMTIQFESAASIPDAASIREEIARTLAQAAKDLRPGAASPGWSGGNGSVERLSWTGVQNNKEFVFEYFLWKRQGHGAIIAAKYHAADAGQARQDAERIVRSLRVENPSGQPGPR